MHTAVKTKNSRINSFLGSIWLLEFIVRVWNWLHRYLNRIDRYFFKICLYLGYFTIWEQFPQCDERFCMQKKVFLNLAKKKKEKKKILK